MRSDGITITICDACCYFWIYSSLARAASLISKVCVRMKSRMMNMILKLLTFQTQI